MKDFVDCRISPVPLEEPSAVAVPGLPTPEEEAMTPYRERLEAGEYAQEPTGSSSGSYSCPDCDRTFRSKHGLKIHQGKEHNGVVESVEEPVAQVSAGDDES